MTQIADYIIVTSRDDDYLNGYHHFFEKVNSKLRKGYQLHGQPFAVERVMCQALIISADATSQNGHAMPESASDTTTFYQRSALK